MLISPPSCSFLIPAESLYLPSLSVTHAYIVSSVAFGKRKSGYGGGVELAFP